MTYKTSGYSFSTRNAVSKQDGESYVMNQESSVVVEDVVKGRLLARVARSEVVVNKAPFFKKDFAKKIGKKIGNIRKIGSLSIGAFAGVIIAAIVGFIGIIIGICFLLGCCCSRKAKKAQSAAEAEQETATDKTNDSSKPQTSKTEDV
ncbi:PREDICTED: uncharacterized protein LOC109130212 [Camelina sativa]|uniref:Uncharacterized protein LOC109130212 n=1 Tax=Camelina sativa TaxID=90675 RepID=A0ABM1R7T1_CAMSA|nr:PREDICTED: uncharacterized protein LOC109130212 [Camelina sativa]